MTAALWMFCVCSGAVGALLALTALQWTKKRSAA